MCGIFCVLHLLNKSCNVEKSQNEFMQKTLSICEENIKRRGPDCFNSKQIDCENFSVLLAVSVLWLQGSNIVEQPVEFEQSYFLYNGDIFGGILDPQIQLVEGDTKPLLHLLANSNDIPQTLTQIHGPYAFIFLNKSKTRFYFGRDVYGRRSLLIGKRDNSIILSSVANKSLENLIELPSIGTFCVNLTNTDFEIQLFPWKLKNRNFHTKLKELEDFLKVSISVSYSGNLENTNAREFVHPDAANLQIFESIKDLNVHDSFLKLANDSLWNDKLETLLALVSKSIEKRIATQPNFCRNCVKDRLRCDHCLCGVLFSGGVDCAVLALLCDKYVDNHRPIDLLNVAFEKNGSFDTPDRLTGLRTVEELRILRPERKWNFIEINVSQEELAKERSERIAGLIYPLNSILDESLGCAFWFASRGKVEGYASPCRVLLVGSGADELFGGYTKHRAALKQNGWGGLHESLELDWQNISHRNLARDDRVISDHGRQIRTPYLDEDLVEYVRDLHTWEKTCPIHFLKQGLGEKILLRSLAFKLGLRNAATFPKRAVQFGSRIANSKENANEVSPRL